MRDRKNQKASVAESPRNGNNGERPVSALLPLNRRVTS